MSCGYQASSEPLVGGVGRISGVPPALAPPSLSFTGFFARNKFRKMENKVANRKGRKY
jgi:hypothetical protein